MMEMLNLIGGTMLITLLSYVEGQTLSLQGSSSSVQLGDSFQFTCTMTGGGSLQGGLSFQRGTGSASSVVSPCIVNTGTCAQFNGLSGYSCGCVTGQTKIYTNITSVSIDDGDIWRCQYNVINSNTINLDVQYAPNITSAPSNKDVTENTSPNIDCSSNITPGNPSTTSYRWTGPGGYSKDGAVLDRLVTKTQGGVYTCTATNTAGLSDTAQVNINVQYAPVITSVPSNKDVTENTSPNIDCSSNITPGNPSTTSYRWTGPGGYSKDGAVLDRLVTRTQGGVYTCTATNTPGLSDTAQVNINVLYAPVTTSVPSNKNVTENTSPNIDCSSNITPGNPSTTSYRWTGPGGYSKDGAVLDRLVTRTQGGVYTCTATNTAGLSDTALVNINVQYGPGTSVSVTPSSLHTVVEGTGPVSITCTADCNPTCGLQLRKGNTDVGQGQVTLDKVIRTQAGDYTCVSANGIGNVTKLFTLVIYYLDSPQLAVSKPRVEENVTVSLACSVSSSPTSQMTIRHVDNDTVLLTEVTNLGQYVIQRVQCLHNGTYQCSADNTQIPVTKTTSASLDVLCSPRHDNRRSLTLTLARNINETASMVVDVIANPLPNFTWWRSSDDLLEPINNSTVHTVSSTDFQTTLQINVTQTRDYGKYALKMENSQGGREIVFTLTGKSRPYPPSSLGVLAGQTSAALSWISNFNGGAPQTYFLEYRSLASSWRNSSESGIPDPGRKRLVTYNITGLAHSTFYEYKLYSWNTYGTSDVLMINTTSLIVAALGSGFPVAAVVGGISAALLVIITVAAVVLLYKRGVCATKERSVTEEVQRISQQSPELTDTSTYSSLHLYTNSDNQYEKIKLKDRPKAATLLPDANIDGHNQHHIYENQQSTAGNHVYENTKNK